MKLVEITSRRVSINNKMHGKGGQYKFDDRTAAMIVRNRDGKIIQDLGQDETSALTASDEQKRLDFLQMVKDNAPEIISILDEVYREQRDEDSADSEDFNKSKENAENSNTINASSNESGNDQDKTSDDADDNSDTANNDVDSSKTENKGTAVPDGFPSKDKLIEAGFTTLESIPRDPKKLEEAGLSTRSINSIGVRLKEIDGE